MFCKVIVIIRRVFTIKNYIWIKLLSLFSPLFSDRKFLELLFPLKTGYKLNLDNPKTFNEKLQWLKLYDRRKEYSVMVDKFEAKKYVSDIIGVQHIIPTLAVFDRAEEINLDILPEQFVLKCTHDSGGVLICKDKTKLVQKEVVRIFKNGLKRNYFYLNREWPYKNVKPRIIVETFMSDGDDSGLKDYKFFCFHGEPKIMFLLKGRQEKPMLNFYDMDFNKLPFERGYPNFYENIEKPEGWEEMISFARKLSKDLPFVRVDFYSIKGKIYFGELTFYPGSGMEEFNPKKWDYLLGSWINLKSL